ncbi:hypothetical protein B0H10DRAFT_2433123 [Mycena sp. CBHHK59/15]|nr:hypothetical protein B0H10DRAFT_2433123 [Mycena sp. CBHHK59/15]
MSTQAPTSTSAPASAFSFAEPLYRLPGAPFLYLLSLCILYAAPIVSGALYKNEKDAPAPENVVLFSAISLTVAALFLGMLSALVGLSHPSAEPLALVLTVGFNAGRFQVLEPPFSYGGIVLLSTVVLLLWNRVLRDVELESRCINVDYFNGIIRGWFNVGQTGVVQAAWGVGGAAGGLGNEGECLPAYVYDPNLPNARDHCLKPSTKLSSSNRCD